MRAFLLLLAVLALAAVPAARADGEWLFAGFEQNLSVTVDPATPIESQPTDIFIQVRDPRIFVDRAHITWQYRVPDATRYEGPFQAPFLPLDDLHQRFSVRIQQADVYPNGTIVAYQITAYDFFIDPRVSEFYNYTVSGAVQYRSWKFETFDENLNGTYSPRNPQPHEPVTVRIRSLYPEVTIGGANLYVTYQYFDNPPLSGGYPFRRDGNDSMAVEIPGYPAGTTVIFFIVAWDLEGTQIDTEPVTYTLSVSRYTNNPPERFPPPETVAGGLLAVAVSVPVLLWFLFRRKP